MRLTKKQIQILHEFFEDNQRPNQIEVEDLSRLIGSNEIKVKRWFRNRRMKTNETKEIKRKVVNNDYSERRSLLMESFSRCEYPESEEIERLAALLRCTSTKVRNWFQNRRRLNRIAQETRNQTV